MSFTLDRRLENTGTRFLLLPLPRYVDATVQPEEVVVSVPPDKMLPGPADDRMFVVDAVNKQPYSRIFRPPYSGPKNPPVEAGADGHFTHLVPGTREFSIATMYATVRRALDIWEDYFGRQIEWHFESDFSKMELIPLIEWDNAQSGYGFLEFGFGRKPSGGIDRTRPYCENFDVLVHEVGHSIVFSEVGVPSNPSDPAIDYGGLHEASGDLAAIVAVLHFHTVTDRLLERTRGNLFTVNELDRVGELSADRQIRVAFNDLRMSDVGDESHERSLPLTGGIFDIFVEVFQKELVAGGLISATLAADSTQGPGQSQDLDRIQRDFDRAYTGHEEEFKTALITARDYLGRLLAKTWTNLRPPNFLTYHDVLRTLLRSDRDPAVSGGQHQETIRSCFAWREISLVPTALLMRPRSLRECGLLPRPLHIHTPEPDGAVPEPKYQNAGRAAERRAAAPAPAAVVAKRKKKAKRRDASA
jgi:hypothetical protein